MQRDDDLAKELELLKRKIEVEQLAKAKGVSGLFHFKHTNAEGEKSAKPA